MLVDKGTLPYLIPLVIPCTFQSTAELITRWLGIGYEADRSGQFFELILGQTSCDVEVIIEVIATIDSIFEIIMHFLRTIKLVNSDQSIVIYCKFMVFLVLMGIEVCLLDLDGQMSGKAEEMVNVVGIEVA